jgi:lysophospholipase L1-like esterase
VILALGDSITDDLQSWFEILRAMIAQARPQSTMTMVNAGVSGARSTDVLASAPLLTRVRPTVVFVMIGTNDAARIGPISKPIVSDVETDANVRAFRAFVTTDPSIRHVFWLTPPPPHEELLGRNELVASAQLSIRYADVARKAALIRRLPDDVVDLMGVFGTPPASDHYLPDGVHPNLEGQKIILRTVLTSLVTHL